MDGTTTAGVTAASTKLIKRKSKQHIHYKSYMSVLVLLNLLNELRKYDKKAGLDEHFIAFSQRV